MPQITYIDKNGVEHLVKVPVGYSLMEGAYNRGLAGMEAECGGACSCSTCHSYMEGPLASMIGPPHDDEDTMLDQVADRKENSRLTCQIHVTEDMDGLVVRIADNKRY